MNNKKILYATLAALGAQIIFGFSFMFTGVALKTASPMTVIANRYIIAFFGLSLVMLFTKTKLNFKRNIWKLILMSLFQPLMYFIFETYGIQMTSSSFSGVMISMIPVVSMVSGIFILGEKPSVMQYLFALLSVTGVIISVLVGKSEETVTVLGAMLLFGAVISSVGYNITSRKISGEFSVFARTYAMTIIGMISFVLIALVENIKNPIVIITSFLNDTYFCSILYLGVLSSVVAFLLLNFANTYLPIAKTTIFSNVTTVVSVIAGAVFLDEKISLQIAIAVAMIIIGVVGVQVLNVKNNK